MEGIDFERSLATDSYFAVPCEMEADTVNDDHSHAGDVRALELQSRSPTTSSGTPKPG